MVGSAASDRGKEAVGMMALHEALRTVCLNSDWTYSVFWTIRPRPRVRGGTNCKVGDDNGSLMLMWEDGFCRGSFGECLEEIEREDPVRKAFSKMSIQLYNYGEGLMGKVASDKCHKWVFKEPAECEPNVSNYWQSSFDAIPSEWTDQFESGIQTIAVIQAGHGLLQLGSCKIVPEDLHFVLRMRHTFESLGYQSGFYLSHLFSSNRNTSPSSSVAPNQALLTQSLPPLSTWGTRPLPSSTSFPSSSTFQSSASARLGFPQTKDETHMFLFPNACETGVEATMRDHGTDIKWPNGLTFFNALSGRADDAKPFFAPEGLGNKPDQNHHPLIVDQKNPNPNPSSEAANMHTSDGAIPSEFLKLVSHPETTQKMENKFRRSFTLPARMASPASSTSLDQHLHDPVEHRNSEGGVYSDAMETLLE